MPRRKPPARDARRRRANQAPRVRRLSGGLYSLPVYECRLEPVNRLHSPRAQVVSSLSAALVARAVIGDGDRERFATLSLRADGRLLGVDIPAVGTLEKVEVDMRNVFRVPLLLNAERMVVAHNHCAEYVTPSGNDRKLTKRMQIAGACLGLELIDHIVLGPSGAYYSFRDAGEMPDQQRPRRRKRRPK